ncbi:DUF928 domain-containing protein [Deltaproteobacteria bacterium TL4]
MSASINFHALKIMLMALCTVWVGTLITSPLEASEPGNAPKKEEKKMINYRPPMRGVPTRRVGGGVRGTVGEIPLLASIAPSHIGLTTQSQPTLFWFLSAPWKEGVEFTLNDLDGMDPLLELDIHVSKPGFQQIVLADHQVKLKEGVEYEWFVALVPDPEQRSGDVIASGTLKYTKPSVELLKQLETTQPNEHHLIYAENGIWYDTFSLLSEQLLKEPNNEDLKQQRIILLDQVQLDKVRNAIQNQQ